MKCARLPYGRYLLLWCGVWLLVTVPTQLPECYERCKVGAPGDHLGIFSELMRVTGSRSLIEVFLGGLWGSLSWLLQWGASAAMGRLPAPRLFQPGALTDHRRQIASIVVLAGVEAILFGLPLAGMNVGFINYSLRMDDSPLLTITDGSMRTECMGILSAFPLACLIAGFLAAKRRPPASPAVPTNGNDVWPPAPTVTIDQCP